MDLLSALTDVGVLVTSWGEFLKNFGLHTPILCFMMIFTVVGAVDRMRGNKLGYGEKFEEAFHTMGPLALGMTGIIVLTPVLELLLSPILVPVFEMIGASPAMFAGIVLPMDAGAYPLAMELAGEDLAAGNFAGFIVGGTFGMIIIGQIPVALVILEKEDIPYYACGVLVAVITVPLGCFMGGLAMNLTPYKMDFGYMMINLIPLIVVALVVALGLFFKPAATMQIFNIVGKVMHVLLTFAITVSVLQFVTGIRLPLFHLMVDVNEATGLSPLTEALLVVGQLGLMLTGALPMVTWLSRFFNKPLEKFGKMLGINEVSSAGMVASLASFFPTLAMVKDMDVRGKVLNIAFGLCACYALSDHISYPATMCAEMIIPTFVGKMVAGISGLLLAIKLYPMLISRVLKKET